MPNDLAVYSTFSELGDAIVRQCWLPVIEKVAWDPKGRWTIERLNRTDKGVEGFEVRIPFNTEIPIGWTGITEHGYTPTGAQESYDYQKFKLACAATAANATFKEVVGCDMKSTAIRDLVNRRVENLVKTFPYYLRAALWSPQAAKKAVAVVASVGGTGNLTITIDNAGLWNTETKDRCKLLERGMILQGYNGSTDLKKGSPVRIAHVDRINGQFTLHSSDVTFADNDYFVPCDSGSLDDPVLDMPGILDVLDDDNTFQGVNRALAENSWARAFVHDGTSEIFDYEHVSDFILNCNSPKELVAHIETVRRYASHYFADKVRYAPAETFRENFTRVQIDGSYLYADEDMDRDKIAAIDFDNVKIYERGPIGPLHPAAAGWHWVQGRTYVEYIVGKWFTLGATNLQKCGLLKVDNDKWS